VSTLVVLFDRLMMPVIEGPVVYMPLADIFLVLTGRWSTVAALIPKSFSLTLVV